MLIRLINELEQAVINLIASCIDSHLFTMELYFNSTSSFLQLSICLRTSTDQHAKITLAFAGEIF